MKEKKKKSHKDSKKSKKDRDRDRVRKVEKKAKKEKRKLEKKLKKQSKALEKAAHNKIVTKVLPTPAAAAAAAAANEQPKGHSTSEDEFCGPSIDLMNRAKCPETREQWEHRQSQIRRVVDPETGRIRLIKGDGEILEEIVTRDRHKQINHDATRNDGTSFQMNTLGPSSSRYK